MSAKLKAFIDESIKVHTTLRGKVGGAFTSSGGIASGAETTLLSIVQAMLIHGMIVQGRADDKHYGVAVTGRLRKKTGRMRRAREKSSGVSYKVKARTIEKLIFC